MEAISLWSHSRCQRHTQIITPPRPIHSAWALLFGFSYTTSHLEASGADGRRSRGVNSPQGLVSRIKLSNEASRWTEADVMPLLRDTPLCTVYVTSCERDRGGSGGAARSTKHADVMATASAESRRDSLDNLFTLQCIDSTFEHFTSSFGDDEA